MKYSQDYYKDRIFVLLKLNGKSSYFLEYIRNQDFYIDDYIYDIHKKYHMFVLKLPSNNIVIKFIEGRYSEMYNQEEVDQYFKKKIFNGKEEVFTPVYSILTKRDDYQDIFKKILNIDFGADNITLNEDAELDYPPFLESEIFNYDFDRKKKNKSTSRDIPKGAIYCSDNEP
jgi:hypothetical protein